MNASQTDNFINQENKPSTDFNINTSFNTEIKFTSVRIKDTH